MCCVVYGRYEMREKPRKPPENITIFGGHHQLDVALSSRQVAEIFRFGGHRAKAECTG